MDWPDDFEPYRWEFYLQPNTRIFRSPITRTRQVLQGQGPRWIATGSFRFDGRGAAERRRAQRFEAMLDKLKGQVETVNVGDLAVRGGVQLGPNLDLSTVGITKFTDGDSPETLTGFTDGDSPETITYFSGGTAGHFVYGGWPIGAGQVLVAGYPGTVAQLYAGDYVQLGSFLYRLTEDAIPDYHGRAYLYLNRGLVEAVAHNATPIFTRPRTPMQLIDDDQSRRSVDISGVREYSVSLIEAFF